MNTKPSETPDSSIATALSVGTKTVCNGKEIVVLPVRTGKMFTLIERVADLEPLFEKSRNIIATARAELLAAKANPDAAAPSGIGTMDVVKMITEYRRPIYDLICIVVGNGLTHEDIDEWELEALVKVLLDIVSCHQDFFIQRVVPQFTGLVQVLFKK